MDRRETLKALALTTLSAGVLLDACKEPEKKPAEGVTAKQGTGGVQQNLDRRPEEIARFNELMSQKFFTDHEMATITILGDIIIPRDDVSGSASDAKVPDFIEFIVKDMPQHQTPMRGGLRWLDVQCLRRWEKPFKDCSHEQQMQLVDEIAWPEKAKPEVAQGVAFFSLIRNLTCTGFYTSEIGIRDLGYKGNTPNQWNGVPDDVLKQYGVSYTEKELKECVSFNKA